MKMRVVQGMGAMLALTVALTVSAAIELKGAEAPDFVLKSVTGKNMRLSEYRGEVVMLSFSASWCGDCRTQLEELAGMHSRYRDAGVTLLTVSLDQSERQASELAKSLKSAYPVLHDAGGAVGRMYEIGKLPAIVLIDRSGTVREVFEGYRRGNELEYLESVQALLRE